MRQSSRSARDRAISLFIVLLLLMSAGSNFFVSVSQAAQAQDITSDLVAHWKLDETSGTTAADATGSYDGTLVNFPGDDSQWIAGETQQRSRF